MIKEDKELISLLLDKLDPASALWRVIEIREVRKLFKQEGISGPVLDLGCGEGTIGSIVFNGRSYAVTGLDNWQDQLVEAQKLAAYKSLVAADASALPFSKDAFSAVFSNSVIEHIKEVDKVLMEVSGILRPGGKFIFTVPSDKFGEYLFFYDFFLKLRAKRIARWYKDKRNKLLNHYNLMDKNGWEAKLNRYGLKVTYAGCYLSKYVLMYWDLIAALWFILRKLKLGFILRKNNKVFYALILKVLNKYYSRQSPEQADCAGLIIVAEAA